MNIVLRKSSILATGTIFITLFLIGCSGKPSFGQDINGKFVYSSIRGEKTGTYVWEDGKEKPILMGRYSSPIWLSSGSKIACGVEGRFAKRNDNGILITDEKGSELEFIKTDSVPLNLSISKNDLKIAYSGHAKEDISVTKIMVFDISKRMNIKVFESPKKSYITQASISPDGGKVIFEMSPQNGEKIELYLIDTDGSNLKLLFAGKTPAWLPDSKHIIFLSNKIEPHKESLVDLGYFYKYNIETGELIKLRPCTRWIDYLRVSQDGKYIYYTTLAFGGTGKMVYVSALDGEGKEVQVTKPVLNGRNYSQDYNPDWFQGS